MVRNYWRRASAVAELSQVQGNRGEALGICSPWASARFGEATGRGEAARPAHKQPIEPSRSNGSIEGHLVNTGRESYSARSEGKHSDRFRDLARRRSQGLPAAWPAEVRLLRWIEEETTEWRGSRHRTARRGTWRGGNLQDSPASALAATGRRRRGNREAGVTSGMERMQQRGSDATADSNNLAGCRRQLHWWRHRRL